MGTQHNWELLEGAHPSYVTSGLLQRVGTQKSDVHQCRRCGQICLSEVGGPPIEDVEVGLLEPCDLAVVRQVMTS